MTCRQHRGALVDLARRAPPDLAGRDVEAHVRECSACAAELVRQRELTAVLHELAAEAAASEAPADLEARLIAAFAARQPLQPGIAPRGGRRAGRWIAAAAAAAGLSIAIWSGAGGRFGDVPADRHPAAAPERNVPGGAAAAASRPSTAPPPVVPGGTSREPTVRARRPAGAPTAPAAGTASDQPLEFQTVPAAAGLPPLESARIVRLELPVSALPEYGVEIVSYAAVSAVQADLLVGQDGMARGIRLVRQAGAESRSTQ
jgi:hypothetical protein